MRRGDLGDQGDRVLILGPRLVIAGTHSGVGKTTVATGLMAALAGRGARVAPAKVGPDFIDPGYHALATGRPGRNLDVWMCGPDLIGPLAGRAGAGADVLVIEGVMGLFDGAADGTPSSTADVAAMLDAPIVLVVDCSAQAASVAALVHGFRSFDRRLRVAGVILNRLGSAGHEAMAREALAAMEAPLPVLGALHRDDRFGWRDRHLGLVPVAERPAEVGAALAQLAEAVRRGCDLDAIVALARSAPPRPVAPVPLPEAEPGARARVAVAGGRAFTFSYPDNLEALVAAGAEIVGFDPLTDECLPDGVDGMVVGGGFPEVMAGELAANTALLAEVRDRVVAGMPTWAECGGLLWLARSLDGHRLAGAIHADGIMTDRLTLGYRSTTTAVPTPLGPPGTTFRGHEFHYSRTEPAGGALEVTGRFGRGPTGFASPSLLASYVHVHLAGHEPLARAFVAAATRATTTGPAT